MIDNAIVPRPARRHVARPDVFNDTPNYGGAYSPFSSDPGAAHDRRARAAYKPLSSYQRLCLVVLEMAIHDLDREGRLNETKANHAGHWKRDAVRWFMSNADTCALPFWRCADALGLDAGAVRRALLVREVA